MTPIALVLAVLLAAPAVSSAEGGSAEPLAAPAAALPGPSESRAADSGPSWDERVLWHRGQEGDAAYFLPQRALDKMAPEEFPLREKEMAVLRTAFRMAQAENWPEQAQNEEREAPPECFTYGKAYRPNAGPVKTLRAAVRASDLTLVGRAAAVVPGILPARFVPADMVYLEVVEVLRDPASQLRPGQVLGLVQDGGRARLGGLLFCEHSPFPGATIAPGDLLLVVGKPHETAAEVVEPRFRLPVEGELVLPGPYASVVDQLPMPLSELVASLAPEAVDPAWPDLADLQRSEPASGDPAYLERVLWHPEKPGQALFAPKTVLESTPIDDLPLGDFSKRWLLWQVGHAEPPSPWWAGGPLNPERWKKEQRAEQTEPIRACEVPRDEFRVSRSRGWPDPLLTRIQSQDATIVGSVVAVVPGWAWGWAWGPAEMVYIRVDEVLRDRKGRLKAGMVVHKSRPAGEVVVGGQAFCSERDPWEIEIQAGDSVLMGGELDDGGAYDVDIDFMLLVRDGLIQPRPASPVSDRLPVPLAELREQVRTHPRGLLEAAIE